jgi:hypothetical protein
MVWGHDITTPRMREMIMDWKVAIMKDNGSWGKVQFNVEEIVDFIIFLARLHNKLMNSFLDRKLRLSDSCIVHIWHKRQNINLEMH